LKKVINIHVHHNQSATTPKPRQMSEPALTAAHMGDM
jgi:hypothetical protein